MPLPRYRDVRASFSDDDENERRQLLPEGTTTADITVTGPITLTLVTTITSLPLPAATSSSSSTRISISQPASSSTCNDLTKILPISTGSSTSSTSSVSRATDLASSSLGIPSNPGGVQPVGSSSRIPGTVVLGIVLGALAFLFIVVLGFIFWRRRRSTRNAVPNRDASGWMDRWEGGLGGIRRSTNAPSAHRSMASTSTAAGVESIQLKPQIRPPLTPPSPIAKPGGSPKRAKHVHDLTTNMNTNTNTTTVKVPIPATSPATTSAVPRDPKRCLFGVSFLSCSPSPSSSPPSPVVLQVTVMYSFTPSLPDELRVKIGEQLRVVHEFDDGWALCVNARGKQGMVPVECLAVTGALHRIGEEAEPDLDDPRLRKRGSSLEPHSRAER